MQDYVPKNKCAHTCVMYQQNFQETQEKTTNINFLIKGGKVSKKNFFASLKK